ncbi:MAG: tetratricopeptide repeat protein [Polyangiaceae bacterium]
MSPLDPKSGPGGGLARPEGEPRAKERTATSSTKDGAEGTKGPGENAVDVRLAIGREGLGLEIGAPVLVGFLRVTDLLVSIGSVKFPVDVSGGIARFRNRRGQLERVRVEIASREAERLLAPKLVGILAPRAPDLWIELAHDRARVGLACPKDGTDGPTTLAFDLVPAFFGEDLYVVVANARGADVPRPPLALAIAAASLVLGSAFERSGSSFVLRGAALALARALLPDAGARVPSVDDFHFTGLALASGTWVVQGGRARGTDPASPAAIRARELADLAKDADDALVDGRDGDARSAYLALLESAPRHPEISRRIAEIDRWKGGRAEAALAVLAEADRDDSLAFGSLTGDLHAEAGSEAAALAAYVHEAETEPHPATAARAFERAAFFEKNAHDALAWLDHALTRKPADRRLRWARAEARLRLGRIEDALADVQHVEANTTSSRDKHLVWRRAGTLWQKARLGREAVNLFERALRFVPDEPRSLAGLGAALVAAGRAARGVALLHRAVEKSESKDVAAADIVLSLARALAEDLGDRPAAIARVRGIAERDPLSSVARGLEGRWRRGLGDRAGASIAFARMREILAHGLPAEDPGAETYFVKPDEELVELLREAATFEMQERGDLRSAERTLAVALRLWPSDPLIARDYRALTERLVPAVAATPDDVPDSHAPVSVAPESSVREPFRFETAEIPLDEAHTEAKAGNVLAVDFGVDDDSASADDNAAIERLTQKLQSDPTDDAVVDELVVLLTRAERGHELLALLASRLEDATPERRLELLPKTVSVLRNLAEDAEAKGRTMEAALFRDAVQTFSS